MTRAAAGAWVAVGSGAADGALSVDKAWVSAALDGAPVTAGVAEPLQPFSSMLIINRKTGISLRSVRFIAIIILALGKIELRELLGISTAPTTFNNYNSIPNPSPTYPPKAHEILFIPLNSPLDYSW